MTSYHYSWWKYYWDFILW